MLKCFVHFNTNWFITNLNFRIILLLIYSSILLPSNVELSSSLASSSSSSISSILLNNSLVSGVCSRPNIPPNARIRYVSPERVKFAENETIYVMCEEHSFPHHVQKRKCIRGHWEGRPARCGKAVLTKLNRLEAYNCTNSKLPILDLNLTQSDETPYALPPNSFHFTRVPENLTLSVYGSDCYRWLLQFEEPVEIQFLLIDINIQKSDSIRDRPQIDVQVANRKCKLEHSSFQVIEQDEIYGNYFFCDLESNLTLGNFDNGIIKTDTIEMIIKMDYSNRSVGLEAVFVGETFKKQIGSNRFRTDCGKLEVKRTGVLEQVEMHTILISCNDSFIPASPPKSKFTCDVNGMWQGEWPLCLPKVTCPKEDIINNLDDSIQLEQIGNVYFINDTEWYAIDHTWVHYSCSNLDGIMVGKNERTCFRGRWTNRTPHCTTALHSGSFTITIIIIILIILVIVFSLIVYLSIRAHTKKIHRKLESTKYELEEKALNKQISTSDYYTDVGLDTIYEDCKEIYNVPMYEMAEDEDVRYQLEPHNRHNNANFSLNNQQILNEPEYLTMTEGTASRKAALPQPPGALQSQQSTADQDLYEYQL